MNISEDFATFDDIKSAFDTYTHQFNAIKANIELLEMNVQSTEKNEKILKDAYESMDDRDLKASLLELLQDYVIKSKLDASRSELIKLYDERSDMVNDIKRLLVTMDLPSNMCPLCFEKPVDVFIKVCGHTYCSKCIALFGKVNCPMCRSVYTYNDIRNLIFS